MIVPSCAGWFFQPLRCCSLGPRSCWPSIGLREISDHTYICETESVGLTLWPRRGAIKDPYSFLRNICSLAHCRHSGSLRRAISLRKPGVRSSAQVTPAQGTSPVGPTNAMQPAPRPEWGMTPLHSAHGSLVARSGWANRAQLTLRTIGPTATDARGAKRDSHRNLVNNLVNDLVNNSTGKLAGLGLSPSIPVRSKRLQLGFPRRERYTRGRKARRWSRAKVKWEMSVTCTCGGIRNVKDEVIVYARVKRV